ncbi:MAG TPA: hypothetical protein VHD90_15640 [Phototrophicaceae bacterium]|nr:hypothetical protein [Phototrophicaceae bacterium]
MATQSDGHHPGARAIKLVERPPTSPTQKRLILSRHAPSIVTYARLLDVVARASQLPFDFFIKRVWLGIPFFAGIVIVPSIFLTSGNRLFDLVPGPIHFGPSAASLVGLFCTISGAVKRD